MNPEPKFKSKSFCSGVAFKTHASANSLWSHVCQHAFFLSVFNEYVLVVPKQVISHWCRDQAIKSNKQRVRPGACSGFPPTDKTPGTSRLSWMEGLPSAAVSYGISKNPQCTHFQLSTY